jgi:hypothetical protein
MNKINKGAAASAIVQRKRALDKYYLNPKICEWCGKVIEVKDHEKVGFVKSKRFCDIYCAGLFNGEKQKGRKYNREKKRYQCFKCSVLLEESAKRSRMCSVCFEEFKTSAVLDLTLKEIRSKYNINQYHAKIRGLARSVYKKANSKLECVICGYNNHSHICHIKPIASFSMGTTLKEVNKIENLTSLCPNHHWEFDNGLIKI